MNTTEFFIRLSLTNGLDKSFTLSIIEDLTNQTSVINLLNQLKLTPKQTSQFYQHDITQTLAWLDNPNHHIIHYFDDSYPTRLKQISNPPLILFVLGNIKLLQTPQLAMVGSRQFSEYGAQWARYFASELTINGLTITSGLALGIDAISHRGALEGGGKTIAVLGSGLNHIAPKTNLHLAEDILAQEGTIISEYIPTEKARSVYYPRRNRIISGLSLGTFIIEASLKSGSLITAKLALEQNRDVFALPGNIINDNSDGTNWLIQQGAYLVTKPNDILEHYYNDLIQTKEQFRLSNTIPTIIHPEIYSIINSNPIPVDIIAQYTQQPISDITVKLLELELAGLIKTVSGGYIRLQNR